MKMNKVNLSTVTFSNEWRQILKYGSKSKSFISIYLDLSEISNNPGVTQKELAVKVGKSERTIKTRTVEMQEKGYICRENGKRNGKWKILIEI